MERMIKSLSSVCAAAVLSFGPVVCSIAEPLSIYEIQYTTDAAGTSPLNGSIVDCKGGIVIHTTYPSSRVKLTLYDPNYPDGWGGIMAKDLDETGAFDAVNVGDRVFLANMQVEDFRGTTFLQYSVANNPSVTVISTGNPLPRPLLVPVDEIAAPVEGAGEWVVADRRTEKYEAMLVKVVDASVQGLDYGKAYDNYILRDGAGRECWASDYMNADKETKYHPLVQIGQRFCGVSGIVEQYEGVKYDIYYDYYQLLTAGTGSFIIDQIADLNGDCVVDFRDFEVLSSHWLEGRY
jgi:hypothetical protein